MGRATGRHAGQRGAAAVEFALLLPVLLMILFGILEFGRVWSQYQVFEGAAREGARCASVKATALCTIQNSINDASQPYTPANTATVQILNSSGGVVATTGSLGCTNTYRGYDVKVSWQQPLQISIPFWSNVTVTPTIQAVFRCE